MNASGVNNPFTERNKRLHYKERGIYGVEIERVCFVRNVAKKLMLSLYLSSGIIKSEEEFDKMQNLSQSLRDASQFQSSISKMANH